MSEEEAQVIWTCLILNILIIYNSIQKRSKFTPYLIYHHIIKCVKE